MSIDEKKPILQDSGIHMKACGFGHHNQSGQQHLTIEPIEFDHKHRNMYGYLAGAASILMLINYLMIQERACQISIVAGLYGYDLIQSFHMTALIVGIMVFVLSYFNFAVVIYDFKLLFYTTAALIFVCACLLIYNAVAIVSLPCVSLSNSGIASIISAPPNDDNSNIFSAGDGIGVTVFVFNILGAGLLFFTGRRFYQKH